MEVLVHLITNSNRVVSIDELLETYWPGLVVEESTVHRVISQIRSSLGDSASNPKYIKTISKRGYKAIAGTRPAQLSRGSTIKIGKLSTAILGCLLAVVTATFFYWTKTGPEEVVEQIEIPDLSIAVLPFVNMSDDAANEYFSDGVSEEILNVLAKIPELRVTARTSAFSFRGKGATISEIGRQLKVTHVLEGSVRKSGEQIRITAQLIEAGSEFHVWSETYARELDDVFAIQDEIATEIAEKLELTLNNRSSSAQEIDGQAYSLYLQALFLRNQYTQEGLVAALDLLEQVLLIAPDFSPALFLMGMSLAESNIERSPEVREWIDRANANDPYYAPPVAMLGYIAIEQNDLVTAERFVSRALSLDKTDYWALFAASMLSTALGRTEDRINLSRYILERDPVNTGAYWELGIALWDEGKFDESIETAQKLLTLSPGADLGHYLYAINLLYKGELQEALVEIEQEPYELFRLVGSIIIYHALGEQETADLLLKELIAKYSTERAYFIAMTVAYMGQKDLAFQYLDTAAEDNTFGMIGILKNQHFGNLYEDPRWQQFLEKINRAPEQIDAIEFKVDLPESAIL